MDCCICCKEHPHVTIPLVLFNPSKDTIQFIQPANWNPQVYDTYVANPTDSMMRPEQPVNANYPDGPQEQGYPNGPNQGYPNEQNQGYPNGQNQGYPNGPNQGYPNGQNQEPANNMNYPDVPRE